MDNKTTRADALVKLFGNALNESGVSVTADNELIISKEWLMREFLGTVGEKYDN